MKFVKQFLVDIKQVSDKLEQYKKDSKNQKVFLFIFNKKKESKVRIKNCFKNIIQLLCKLENSREKKVQKLQK